ncbi:AraC family transcriptional regulator [Aquabacterium sp.]|uniref:AraC family transcriptional regulator n=1 Tax=Aquabacterium sp. TaxID=1872578 RepID=UPI0025BE0C13|nr:AraC family transcriptional regulator [Aquabacterium sp.]
MSLPSPRNATIPATYGLSLLSLMTEHGHAEQDILAGSELSRAQLQDQHTQISGWQYVVMLNNAWRLDGDSGLAYELGLRSQVTKHGFVGFGLISCATLREAIEFSERYFQARVSVFHSDMSIKGDQVVIDLRETMPLGPQRALILDLVLVELCSLFAKVLGTDTATAGWTSEIWVPYAEPVAYASYKDRLPRFRFNQAAVQIRFPARMLDEPIPSADAVSVQLAIDRCEQEIAKKAAEQTTADLVRGHLICSEGRYPDVAAMAQKLLLSERTLKRRLQDEGCSFQSLLDQARHQDSLRLLGNPTLAIKQVAEAVGYTDPANFARAFAKWTGFSPREWRQRQTSRGPN